MFIPFRYNDGGRSEAGYVGKAGDCSTRSISIATGIPYQDVYDQLNALCKTNRTSRVQRDSARNGVGMPVIHRYMKSLGWQWTPTMQIGSGCRVHLAPEELPSGRLVVRVSKHLVAVIDGVIHDTSDCSRAGTRCVYGYWQPAP
jgi:hypothetical protein